MDGRAIRHSLLLGAALTAFSLALHFLPVWETMLNRGPETWDGKPLPHDFIAQCVEEHTSGTDYSFRRRPLTPWCVDALVVTGLSVKTSFIALSFALFFVSGLLVHRVARFVGSSTQQALLAQALFHLSPTVLCAWFDPMYTFDEPIQYAALLVAMLASLQGRTMMSVVALTVALIAHETSFFVFPVLLFCLRDTIKHWWPTIVLPTVLFFIFLAVYLPHAGIAQGSITDAVDRLGTLRFNFSTVDMAMESLCYLSMVMALPVFLLVRYQRSMACTEDERRMLRAFWIALVLNTVAVLVAAKAREARSFALPLIIVWPLIGKVVAHELK
ncbi:MAG TPA: hypothetical protein PK760_13130, partial [Flavobacteriales bacterium]|nr:hypothetical protein [Flavobacteriales bacterium]